MPTQDVRSNGSEMRNSMHRPRQEFPLEREREEELGEQAEARPWTGSVQAILTWFPEW